MEKSKARGTGPDATAPARARSSAVPRSASATPAAPSRASTASSASTPPMERGSPRSAAAAGPGTSREATKASRPTRSEECTKARILSASARETPAAPMAAARGRTEPHTTVQPERPTAPRVSMRMPTTSASASPSGAPTSSTPSWVNWRASPERLRCSRTTGAAYRRRAGRSPSPIRPATSRAMGSVRSGRSIRSRSSASMSWNGTPRMRPARSRTSRLSSRGVSTGR